jgi:hypothetical protein
MIYSHYYGVMKRKISKIQVLSIALLFALTATMGVIQQSRATSHFLEPFTQQELIDNWVTDRQNPSGGVESVSFGGRNDVAAISVVGDDQFTPANGSTFYHFEGIKKIDDFGTDVQVDLYVPSEWQEAAVVNVGFWASDDPITSYPIIVYRNSATVDAGFYTWTYDWGAGAWVYVLSDVDVNYDGWNTLGISLSETENVANYFINSEKAGSVYNAGDFIGQVFLNHYNDGVRDYTAHWHAGIEAIPEQVTGMEVSVDGESLGCYPYINTRDITVSWNADDAATHYEYQADADKVAPYDFTTTVSNIERSGQIRDEDGTYNYRVRAVNAGGVAGEWSEWCGVTLDRIAPVAEITSPLDGAVLKSMVNLVGEVTDENPMNSHFEIRDAGNKSVASNTKRNGLKTHEFTWDTAQVDDGEYAIYFEARDKASNKDGSRNNLGDSVDKISVTVDNTKPTLSIVNPVQGQYVSGIVELRGGASDNLSGIDRVEVRVNEIDAIAGKYKASALGMQIADYDLITENYSYDIDTTAFNDGPHRIQVRTYDNAGNRRILYLDVDVDNTAPEVDAGNDQTVIGKSAALSATATDNLTNVAQLVYLWEVIDGPSINTVKLLPASNAAEVEAQVEEYGEYEFRVTVSDEAGNQASDTVQVTFTEYSGMSVIPDVSNRGRSGQAPANNRNNVNNPQALAATNANQVGAQNQAQQETEETEDEEGGEVLAEDTAGAFRKNGMSSASTTAGSLAEQASVNSSLLSDFWWIPASIIVAAMGFFFAGRRVQDE